VAGPEHNRDRHCADGLPTRHTHASWLIEAGEDPTTVEENNGVLDMMNNLPGELG
jgi:hypothetical protein